LIKINLGISVVEQKIDMITISNEYMYAVVSNPHCNSMSRGTMGKDGKVEQRPAKSNDKQDLRAGNIKITYIVIKRHDLF
jgi:hypothetical protein